MEVRIRQRKHLKKQPPCRRSNALKEAAIFGIYASPSNLFEIENHQLNGR